MIPMHPGNYALFRGSWGLIVLVGLDYVFLEKWRGQLTATAPIEEVVEVRGDARVGQDQMMLLGRRLDDF